MGKLKIELNDTQNIRDLLQEAYRLADEQIVQAQNEINKLSVATQLQEEPMDARSKYAKAINDEENRIHYSLAMDTKNAKIITSVFNSIEADTIYVVSKDKFIHHFEVPRPNT